MKALEMYYEARTLSPRDPNYLPLLETAAEQMAIQLRYLKMIVMQDIEQAKMKQRFEDECG